jgi:hypothetical protein
MSWKYGTTLRALRVLHVFMDEREYRETERRDECGEEKKC